MDDLMKAALDAYDKADIKTEDEPTTSKATLLSEERETAIRNHDHAKLAEMDKKFEADMHAIQTTIDQFGEAAFNCITDEHGRKIHLCSNESGVFWVHVKQEGGATPDEEASASANKPNEEVRMNTTMEVGYMSKNSGQALLSWTRWEKAIPHLAIAGFAAGVGAIIGSRMFAAIMKSEARQVLEAGVAREVARKAVAELEEKGASEAEKAAARAAYRAARRNVDTIWLRSLPKGTAIEKILNFAAKWPKLISFLGGFIATVVIEVALELLLPLVNKDYFVQVHVLNFDKKDWKIDDWSHDNGIIAGGDTWSVKTMEAGRSEVQTPWGTKIGKWKNINNITYCFQNSFTLMDGIGVALRAVQADGKAGFAMAYLCKFWTANRLTVKPGYPPSIQDFYDDNNNWPSDRALKYACEVTREDGEKVKIVGSTNALSKVENNIYHFYVTIGA